LAKVIAIGVPTVIDSKTLILDSMAEFLDDPVGAENFINENGGRDDRNHNRYVIKLSRIFLM